MRIGEKAWRKRCDRTYCSHPRRKRGASKPFQKPTLAHRWGERDSNHGIMARDPASSMPLRVGEGQEGFDKEEPLELGRRGEASGRVGALVGKNGVS